MVINKNNKKNHSAQKHKYKKRFNIKDIKYYAYSQKRHYKKNCLKNKHSMTIAEIYKKRCHPILF